MSRSIEQEKAEVARLRWKEGLTLQAIANQLGRSIFWVNSRLDPDYEPKRTRRVAADDQEDSQSPIHRNAKVAAEVAEVQRLRASGLTYEVIAKELNRSVYWVHTRLRDEYRPKHARAEKEFQETLVVPWLRELGHEEILQYPRIEGTGYSQEADILSRLNGAIYVTEVKLHVTHHQLQTAIGQLILHRLAFTERNDRIVAQIALPEETNRRKIPAPLIAQLAEREGIIVLFVPSESQQPLKE